MFLIKREKIEYLNNVQIDNDILRRLNDRIDRSSVTGADILIIPRRFGDRSEFVFPVGTEELYLYFKDRLNEKETVVDIYIDEAPYMELALHSNLIILGSFIVTVLALPIFIDIIGDFIKEKAGSKINKHNVKMDLTIVNGKDNATLFYEGPAQNIGEFLSSNAGKKVK